ncbi:hypothetical protein ACO0QE_003068 [Hanseniaspora vineae]
MSSIDEKKLDQLFALLKQTDSAKIESSNQLGAGDLVTDALDDNKIDFVDDIEDNKREQQFLEIEKNLKKLPKLENSFDKLSNPKFFPNNEEQGTFKVAGQFSKISDPIEILNQRKGNKSNKQKGKEALPQTDTEKWFHIGKTEMTPQIKRDLLVIKHRQALDPKRHYKKDKWALPKNFQVGTLVEDKSEFYSSRINKKQRSSTILGSLINENDTNKYFKRKYAEVQDSKTRYGRSRHNYKSKSNRK